MNKKIYLALILSTSLISTLFNPSFAQKAPRYNYGVIADEKISNDDDNKNIEGIDVGEAVSGALQPIGTLLGNIIDSVRIGYQYRDDSIENNNYNNIHLELEGAILNDKIDNDKGKNGALFFEINLDAVNSNKTDFIRINDLVVGFLKNRHIQKSGTSAFTLFAYENQTISKDNELVTIHKIVFGSAKYDLHVKLTQDGKVKLLLRGGIEVGYAGTHFKKDSDINESAYAKITAGIGLQFKNMILTYSATLNTFSAYGDKLGEGTKHAVALEYLFDAKNSIRAEYDYNNYNDEKDFRVIYQYKAW